MGIIGVMGRASSPNIEPIYKIIGQRVSEARRTKEMSQHSLGNQADLTRSTIANIESGRQRIFLHNLSRIADALEIPLPRLLESSSWKHPGGKERDRKTALANLRRKRPDLSKSEVAWITKIVTKDTADNERR